MRSTARVRAVFNVLNTICELLPQRVTTPLSIEIKGFHKLMYS